MSFPWMSLRAKKKIKNSFPVHVHLVSSLGDFKYILRMLIVKFITEINLNEVDSPILIVFNIRNKKQPQTNDNSNKTKNRRTLHKISRQKNKNSHW